MKAKRQTAIRSLRTMMAVTVVAPFALFAVAAWQQHDVISRLADERIERTLDIVAEHARKIFRTVQVVFGSVDEITRDRTDESLRGQEGELHDRLKLMATAVVDIQSLWVFDATGGAIASSTHYPVPRTLNNSDRDYFQAQMDGKAATFIGKVQTTKLTGDVFFSISKRRVQSDGTFVGVTAVAVLPSAFETFYQHLARETEASFAMIRADGAVLARYPIATTPGIVLDEKSGFRRTIATQPGGGKYTTVSGVDGVERRFSVRRLGELPVYATASLEYSAIRGEWLWWMGKQLAFGIPTVLLLLALEYITLRRTDEFYQEVTRREEAESTLRQSQKMEAVGQLTGGIAHDFNNLLTIIIGNLQSLDRQLPTDESKLHQKLSNAMNGAERAAQLTHRLLAFARRQPLDPKPVDANELISRASELLSRSLGEQIKLETVRTGGLWMTEADPAELEGAIINLAINARDAMPNGGRIIVETSNAFLDDAYCKQHQGVAPGQYVMIAVTDNGTGMSSHTIDHAFEPFFTTKEPGLGTGLGLSQVYGFAKQSGGHVTIESEVGSGTTVKMYLPRSHESPIETVPSSTKIQRGNREVILVVEDDAAVRNYVLELLIELNYDAKGAESGEAAAAVLNDGGQQIDLLLTDVVMPGMNGRQLVQLALAKRPGLRVLYMTGYSRDAIVHQGRLDPGVSLIQKPLTELELSVRIRSLLDRS
jgi:two-component system NtrC family sensor kinase